LKKKLKGKCPCGYVFDNFNDEKTAIAEVRLHFKRFHSDFLPFGINDFESLTLLREEIIENKKLTLENANITSD